MQFKFHIALAVGCVSLTALSAPAFSRPSPRANQHAQPHHDAHQKLARKHGNTNLAIRARAPMQANRAVAEIPSRAFASAVPIFGRSSLVSEARKYIGTNPTDRKKLWCATFMNFVLAKAGYAGTNSDAAKSFAYYGHRISEPKIGAIAVLSRGKRGGHVGVVSGIDSHGNPIIISGNHNRRVGEGVYPRARVIAYVMPSGDRPSTQVANRDAAGAPQLPGPGIDSPIAELLAAINAEQERSQPHAQPARPAEPPVPHRTVQQLPDRLDPALAELLGFRDQKSVAHPQRPAPQRQQRVEQRPRDRVASADTWVDDLFARTDRR